MSCLYGTGMIHQVLCRKAFIKAKWASKLGLSGRGCKARHWGWHPGCSRTGEPGHKKRIWLATDWSLLLCLGWIWSVCGNKASNRMWKRLRFQYDDSFSQWLTKEGECDGKPWWEVFPLLPRNGREWKNHHQKFEVQKAWTTPGNRSTWHLPQLPSANVNFLSSFQWSIWHVFKMQKTLWSHTVFAAHVAGCDRRHLGEGGWLWQC